MPEPSITWSSLVTAAVALYGAVLSTVNLRLILREKTRHLRVVMSFGFLTMQGGGLSEDMLFITARNPGVLAVTLAAVGLLLPEGKQLILPSAHKSGDLPFELIGGKAYEFCTSQSHCIRGLRHNGFRGKVRVRGFYRDQTGRTYRSKPIRLDLGAD